jgi:hypothetical protein
MTGSMTQKIAKKWWVFCRDGSLYDNKKAYFKKRATRGASPEHELSSEKKSLTSYCTAVEWRWRYEKPTHIKNMCSKIVISLAKVQ